MRHVVLYFDPVLQLGNGGLVLLSANCSTICQIEWVNIERVGNDEYEHVMQTSISFEASCFVLQGSQAALQTNVRNIGIAAVCKYVPHQHYQRGARCQSPAD